jgi:hypothetical protein
MSEEHCVRRIVSPHGLIESEQEGTNVCLKLYSIMRKGGKPFDPTEAHIAEQATQRLIALGKIDVLSGLGFAILTDGFMNVNFWGGKAVYLLNQSLYGLNRNDMLLLGSGARLKKLDTNKEGVYCCFEGAIVGHESEAWARYLVSNDTESFKTKKYLEDFLSGNIPRN